MNKLFSLMNFYLEPEKNHCNQMQVHILLYSTLASRVVNCSCFMLTLLATSSGVGSRKLIGADSSSTGSSDGNRGFRMCITSYGESLVDSLYDERTPSMPVQ